MITAIAETFHALWGARNAYIHKNQCVQVPQILHKIKAAIIEGNSIQGDFCDGTVNNMMILNSLQVKGNFRPPIRTIEVSWVAPPNNWIKINYDGASKRSDGQAGCGVIARNQTGHFIASASMDCGQATALEAEVQGLLLAIRMAHKNNWRQVWFEGDSLTTVRAVWNREDSLIWTQIGAWQWGMNQLFSMDFRISHAYREANRVADRLANLGVRSGCIQWHSTMLDEIQKPLDEDRCNFCLFRIL